jgi:hypothetical protein
MDLFRCADTSGLRNLPLSAQYLVPLLWMDLLKVKCFVLYTKCVNGRIMYIRCVSICVFYLPNCSINSDEIYRANLILSMLVFWVVTPCVFIGRYQRFGVIYCLHLRVHRHRREDVISHMKWILVRSGQWLNNWLILEIRIMKLKLILHRFSKRRPIVRKYRPDLYVTEHVHLVRETFFVMVNTGCPKSHFT